MNRLRDPKWVLIFVFAGILAAGPLAQTIIEALGDEGIIAGEVFNDWPTSEHLRNYEHKMEAAAWAGRLSRPWLQYAEFATLKEGGEKVVAGRDGWYFFKPGLKYMLARPEPAAQLGGTNDPIPAILDFRNQLAARGIHLLLVVVPNKESIYPDRLTARVTPPTGILAPRTRDLLTKLKSGGIEVVDLFKEFTEARQQRTESLYLAQDTHWSPIGVSLAAHRVAQRLQELGWIQPGHAEYREKPAPVQRQGDIIRMLQAPRIERSLAPENVGATQVIRAQDNQPYKDEATAEILVLGDSFMRIYQSDTPTSAGFISHLAKELKQPMMSIVNDGGGSTLVREELSARPIFLNKKKVVIWEFVERDIGIGVKGWLRTRLSAPVPSNGLTKNLDAH